MMIRHIHAALLSPAHAKAQVTHLFNIIMCVYKEVVVVAATTVLPGVHCHRNETHSTPGSGSTLVVLLLLLLLMFLVQNRGRNEKRLMTNHLLQTKICVCSTTFQAASSPICPGPGRSAGIRFFASLCLCTLGLVQGSVANVKPNIN